MNAGLAYNCLLTIPEGMSWAQWAILNKNFKIMEENAIEIEKARDEKIRAMAEEQEKEEKEASMPEPDDSIPDSPIPEITHE